MKASILKYELMVFGTDTVFTLMLPANYEICDIAEQNDNIYIWCVVNSDASLVSNSFKIVGTGWMINDIDNLFFLKTVHMKSGLIWHIFKVNEEIQIK